MRSASNWSDPVYVKASNTEQGDSFGTAVALSQDGNTLAVSAPFENSAATGFNDNENNQKQDCVYDPQTDTTNGENCATDSGAVYVY